MDTTSETYVRDWDALLVGFFSFTLLATASVSVVCDTLLCCNTFVRCLYKTRAMSNASWNVSCGSVESLRFIRPWSPQRLACLGAAPPDSVRIRNARLCIARNQFTKAAISSPRYYDLVSN